MEIDIEEESARIRLDPEIFSEAAAFRACYWFTDDLYFEFKRHNAELWVTARLKSRPPTLSEPMPKRIGDFIPELLNAFLDAQLRVTIQAETSAVRELILAKAFAEAGVLEDVPPGDMRSHGDERASTGLIEIKTKTGV